MQYVDIADAKYYVNIMQANLILILPQNMVLAHISKNMAVNVEKKSHINQFLDIRLQIENKSNKDEIICT